MYVIAAITNTSEGPSESDDPQWWCDNCCSNSSAGSYCTSGKIYDYHLSHNVTLEFK